MCVPTQVFEQDDHSFVGSTLSLTGQSVNWSMNDAQGTIGINYL